MGFAFTDLSRPWRSLGSHRGRVPLGLAPVAFALTTAASALLSAAPAQAQPPVSATLQGTFAMTGGVTVAQHVRQEHVGQRVSRSWTFTPACPSGPCTSVTLLRSRATGTDTLLLTESPSGVYSGSGTFYLPLSCAGHRYHHGERVPFTITVRRRTTAVVNGTVVVTAVSATYQNRYRRNLTPCVAVLGHDAASYSGTLNPP